MGKRVLHVITSINRGGAENHLTDLVKGQIEAGFDIAVAYLRGDGYWTGRLRSFGAEVLPLDLKYYGELKPVFRLKKIIQQFKPDFLHAHMPPAEVYCRLALGVVFGGGLHFVISKHNDDRFYPGRFASLLGRWVVRRAQFVIVISKAVGRVISNGLHLAPEKIRLVYYGLDITPYLSPSEFSIQELRAEWGLKDGDLCIGTVARLEPQKSIETLVEGFHEFCSSRSGNAKLVIVGRGKLLENLKHQAREIGVFDRIVWAGFRDDIPVVMAAFDIFALSSIYEGFGLVLLEAMAAKKPVVATRVSAIPEVVEEGKTGILVSPRTPSEFARAFRILEDPELRQTYGRQGRQRTHSEFSVQRMVSESMKVYGECLSNSVAGK